MHERFCTNVIKRCECGVPVEIELMDEHKKEFHIDIKCKFCKLPFKKNLIQNHQNSCLLKPKPCKYCELELAGNELYNHEEICGSKTETCTICNKAILLKEYENHLLECSIQKKNHEEENKKKIMTKNYNDRRQSSDKKEEGKTQVDQTTYNKPIEKKAEIKKPAEIKQNKPIEKKEEIKKPAEIKQNKPIEKKEEKNVISNTNITKVNSLQEAKELYKEKMGSSSKVDNKKTNVGNSSNTTNKITENKQPTYHYIDNHFKRNVENKSNSYVSKNKNQETNVSKNTKKSR